MSDANQIIKDLAEHEGKTEEEIIEKYFVTTHNVEELRKLGVDVKQGNDNNE